MIKQKIADYNNGATLIYEKDNSFDGYTFVIGFRSGSQLDNEQDASGIDDMLPKKVAKKDDKAGLAHLLEHLFFREISEDDSKKTAINRLNNYCLDINAFTTMDSVCAAFSSTEENIVPAIKSIMRILVNKKFTQEQINKEIEVIRHEIDIYNKKITRHDKRLFTMYLKKLLNIHANENLYDSQLVGSVETLKNITPNDLKQYVEKYFNLDNLMISVVTNKPFKDVNTLCEKYIFPKLSSARDESFVVDYTLPQAYNSQNVLIGAPSKSSNVELNLILRERFSLAVDPEKEIAYDIIEERMMNGLSGILYKQLRTDSQLVYQYGLHNIDLETTKLKNFELITNGAKLNKTIRTVCSLIKKIGTQGIPKESFEKAKKELCVLKQSIKTSDSASAWDNYSKLLSGEQLIDEDKVWDYIRNMKFEDINSHLTNIYSKGNISMLVGGDFDTRKIPNLIELEELIGNKAHSNLKPSLNFSISQTVDCVNNDRTLIDDFIMQCGLADIPQQDEKTKPVTLKKQVNKTKQDSKKENLLKQSSQVEKSNKAQQEKKKDANNESQKELTKINEQKKTDDEILSDKGFLKQKAKEENIKSKIAENLLNEETSFER